MKGQFIGLGLAIGTSIGITIGSVIGSIKVLGGNGYDIWVIIWSCDAYCLWIYKK